MRATIAGKKYNIMNWLRSSGPGGRDVVPMFVLGTTDREDEGAVGHDVRVRPVFLGVGPYTAVIAPDDLFEPGE